LVDIWTGAGYQVYTIDSTMSTGVSDINDNNPVTAPTIQPGQAFFFVNNTVGSNTLTIAGTVHVDTAASGAQTVGQTTNVLKVSPFNTTFIGSVLPIGGGLGSVCQFPTNGPTDGTLVNIPQISGGNVVGFTVYTVDSTMNTGFSDINDNNPVAEPIIPVGTGFFFQNNTGSDKSWVQKL